MAKTSRRRAPARSPLVVLGFPDAYGDFGPSGKTFQTLHADIWGALLERAVLELGTRFDKALKNFLEFGRTGVWFVSIANQYLTALGPDFYEGELSFAWHYFRQIFRPHLLSLDEMHETYRQHLADYMTLWEMLARVASEERFVSRRALEALECSGPFTTAQMQYLLERYPRIIEVGPGSGYFLEHFNRHGGDGIGIDNQTYSACRTTRAAALREAGIIIVDEAEHVGRYCDDRALLLSWPEPGSLMPAQSIAEYAAAGGKHVIFKIGGFFGTRSEVTFEQGFRRLSGKSDTSGLTVASLLQALHDDWIEVEEPPEFVPELLVNNLWCFRRA